MAQILRYDESEIVTTPLDPIEDTVSWLSGLRSKGYVSDVLKSKHNFSDPVEIEHYTKLIATYALDAVGLIQQSFSGPPEVSFLPLYYSILNLSNIYIALSGNRVELLRQRSHGAHYDRTLSISDLLSDRVRLFSSGTLGLFYKTLTGKTLDPQEVRLGDMYPFIRGISHEYTYASKMASPLLETILQVKGNSTEGYHLECKLAQSDHPKRSNLSFVPLLERFNPVDDPPTILVSEKVPANTEEEAIEKLKGKVKRYMLYDAHLSFPSPLTGKRTILCHTPIWDGTLLLPEELPIWIAFFHLSNIVRYRPEFLPELQDSTYWAMLLSLRRHAVLRFLLLFWSYLHQRVFILANS